MGTTLQEWFQGSLVADHIGRPLVVYRGEHGQSNGPCFQSRLGSLSFGSLRAANIYAMHPNSGGEIAFAPRITPAYLAIRKPVMNRPDDPFIDLAEIASAIGRDKAEQIAFELAGFIENTCNWLDNYSDRFPSVANLLSRDRKALKSLYLEAYAVFASVQYVSWFRVAGFDGAIHAGSGENAGEVEYKVFSKEQVLCMSMRESPRDKFQSIASQTDPKAR